MARRASTCFAVLLVTMMMMEGWRTEAAISCGQVVAALSPCITYARVGGTVPPACCSGVRSIADASKANEDLKIACGCIKQMTASVPGVNYGYISSIPEKCGVSLPFKLTPSIDCSK